MLFNFLLANKAILLGFFLLFLVVFHSFYMVPVEIENVRLTITIPIPTAAPIAVANHAIGMLAVVTDKTIIKTVQRSNILTNSFAH